MLTLFGDHRLGLGAVVGVAVGLIDSVAGSTALVVVWCRVLEVCQWEAAPGWMLCQGSRNGTGCAVSEANEARRAASGAERYPGKPPHTMVDPAASQHVSC